MARLERLAARQDNVVAADQLFGLDLTWADIRGLVNRAHLHRLHRGVYAVGTRRLSRNGWLRAALMAAGPRSFLSHRTGGGLRGLCGLNIYEIHLTVPGARVRSTGDLRIHRTRVPPGPGEVTTVSGLRTAGVALILIQLASTESRDELDRVIELAARRRALDLAQRRTQGLGARLLLGGREGRARGGRRRVPPAPA
jgi:hypothetical protein